MSDLINVKAADNGKYYIVCYKNDVFLGDFDCGDDGFYVFLPYGRDCGYWSSELLHQIAYKLEELNKPWGEEIDRYFNRGETNEQY